MSALFHLSANGKLVMDIVFRGFFSIFSDSNRVSNTRNVFQGSKELQSSKWRSSRRPSWLGTLCRVVTLLVTVETGDMTQVFESPIGSAGNVGGIDLGGWDRTKVVSSTLVFIESSC